jgi:haloalkane dehalogenase
MEPSRVSAVAEAPPDLPASLEAALPFTRHLAFVDGWRQHYLDVGRGPAVVFIHGSPVWSAIWRRVIPLLPEFRVIAPDLLGFGLSDKPFQGPHYRWTAHAARTGALLDALGVEHAVLVGHAWGGPIAASVAVARPKRVAGLVLANTSVLAPRAGERPLCLDRFARAPLLPDLLLRGVGLPVRALGGLQARGAIEPRLAALLRWPHRSPLARSGVLSMARQVPLKADDPQVGPMIELEDRLGQLVGEGAGAGGQWPLGLVWGQRDPLFGARLGAHARAFPQAKVLRTDAGHFLQEEAPGALAEAVRACWKAACG